MAVAEISRTPLGARRRGALQRWSLGALGAVIVAELLAWYLTLNSGGWSYDDNLLLESARFNGFTWSWLSGTTFGHWGMGYPATYSLFDRLMPIDYRWALVAMLVELGIAMLLLARVMEMLFGRGPIPILSAAYLGMSVLLIRSLQWPAQGFQTFPTLIFDLLCLWAYLRYQREPRLRWVVVSAGAILLGLLFYEKPAFMVLYLLLLRAFVLDENARPRAVVRAIWRERIMWFGYAAVLIVYGIGREAAHAGNTGAGALPTIGEFAQGLWLMWGKSLIPQLFGWARPTNHLDTIELVAVCFLQALVVTLVAVSVWRKRTAWRAWTALGLCLIATWLLVEVTRVSANGLAVITDQRYLFDFAWLAPLFVCFAFSRRRPFVTAAGAPEHPPSRRRRVRLPLVAAVLMLAYVCVSVAGAANWQSFWGGVSARTWELNLQSGIARLHRATGTVTVADNFVPGYMIQTSYVPWSYLSLVAPEYGAQINVNGPVFGQLYVVDDTGRPRPAHVARTWKSFELRDRCGAPAGATSLHVERKIPGGLDATAGPYYVLLRYSSAGVAQLPLFIDDGTGYPGLPNRLVNVAQGAGQSIAWLGIPPPRGVILNLPPYVCLRKLAVVTLALN